MKVILAGYNLDTEVIEGLKHGETNRQDITPEVLSASYARISRDPRPVNELRAAARAEVEKARKSNQNIIFKMGHHSVAEHAVFNFDILGVSRFALEELEKFRLCSYTEKSQRYQVLEDVVFVPEEIEKAGLADLFLATVKAQNDLYRRLIENKVEAEDARYVTALATPAQLGMTLNARNLELLFRRFASHPLSEIRKLGREMYNQVKDIAPSIILFTEANPLDRDTYQELRAQNTEHRTQGKAELKEVGLVDYTQNADQKLIAALLHSTSDIPYEDCLNRSKAMKADEQKKILMTAFKNMEFYDSTLREFEFTDLTFELIVSSACFGQLKRHRMATITAQAYDPSLGVTIPSAVDQAEFEPIVKKTEAAYQAILKSAPQAAPYILTGAHRKRVLFKCNARELYHISRLREDRHAQWDIQNISREMVKQAKKVMPLTMLTIGGKDVYPEVYKKVFGVNPSIIP
ncbi:FAD-dependent thymidylate synthase [Candidatus Saganbacteria bacterium]|nr:FAD-dependent thymidylate synthase [Candidatus Saganbacteria bacterium]